MYVCGCVPLHAKTNPLPTGVSPGANYKRRKMSNGECVHTLINERQPGSIFTHVQACVSRCVCHTEHVLEIDSVFYLPPQCHCPMR